MKVDWTPEELSRFEEEVTEAFLAKRIKAPVHLTGGNEQQLIEVFEQHVNPEDWICTTWRSHFHCLLKGVPREQLMQAILNGKSISLNFPEHRILSSAMVGGTAPIAVGLAMGLKRKMDEAVEQVKKMAGEVVPHLLPPNRKVVCFLGDMAAASGGVQECIRYALNHDLPVLWVVEDNGMSVETPTSWVWGTPRWPWPVAKMTGYVYVMNKPHVGVGKWVTF